MAAGSLAGEIAAASDRRPPSRVFFFSLGACASETVRAGGRRRVSSLRVIELCGATVRCVAWWSGEIYGVGMYVWIGGHNK